MGKTIARIFAKRFPHDRLASCVLELQQGLSWEAVYVN
jgi:hypothetical protein